MSVRTLCALGLTFLRANSVDGWFVRGLKGFRAQFMPRCRVVVGVQELDHEVWGDTIDDSCAGLTTGTKLAGDGAAFRGPRSDFSHGSTGF